jgi:RHS repeat-associated protein
MTRPAVNLPMPNAATNITHNQANQLLTFNDKIIIHDENGNIMTVTNTCGTTSYTWDARNKLTGMNGFNTDCSPLSASFKYDAWGRRVEKTINGKTTQYLYDGYDIIQEIEGGAVSANYIRSGNIDEPLVRIKSDGSVRYYQTDALGSVIALTDETGAITTQYAYDPFGNVTVSGEARDNPFQYTGRENDGTGLYYYRARYYNPELQRFISEDPIGLLGGINKFAYVGNNPVNYTDPRGLFKLFGINLSFSYGGTLGIIDVSGQGHSTVVSLTTPQVGAGINFTYNVPQNNPCGESPVFISAGWEHLGFTFAHDFSSFSINLGWAIGPSPVNMSVPIWTIDWDKVYSK